MRVLHMTPELPYEPGGGGGRGREYFLCRRLVELGHDVLNISPVLPDEAHWAQALRDVGVENWVAERPASHLRETVSAVRSEPQVLRTAVSAPVRALEMRIFWGELRELVDLAVTGWRPDIVVIGHDMAAAWANGLPPDVPAVLTLHNLTWHWYLSRARRSGAGAALLLRTEAARYRRHLLGLLPRFQAAVAVSTIEAEESATQLRRARIGDPDRGRHRGVTPGARTGGPPRLLFTGTLSYPPNSRGSAGSPTACGRRSGARSRTRNWRSSVAVRLRRCLRSAVALGSLSSGRCPYGPLLRTRPCGRGPDPHRRRHPREDRRSDGRGPCNRLDITGLGGASAREPGEHLLVADQPEEFAEAAIRLLHDPALRQQIAADARSLAVRHYDWRGLGDEQAVVLRRVVGRH